MRLESGSLLGGHYISENMAHYFVYTCFATHEDVSFFRLVTTLLAVIEGKMHQLLDFVKCFLTVE